MAAPNSPTPLNEAVKAIRPAVVPAAVFSLFINLLALVSPLYMLQVYDRVMASRNMMTLLLLTAIAAFLYIVYGMLESLRTRVLVRGGRTEPASPLPGPTETTVLGRSSGAARRRFASGLKRSGRRARRTRKDPAATPPAPEGFQVVG